jgi:hypothetical protein
MMRLLEKHLRQIDGWLQGNEETGILYRQQLRLSPERRAIARQQVAAALAEIAELSRRLELPGEDEDLAAAIGAMMHLDWCYLGDRYADKLKRCGPVDPRLAAVLDPHLDRLAGLVFLLPALVTEDELAR